MNLPVPVKRVLGVALESDGIRFLLVCFSRGQVRVEKAEWHACPDVAGWAAASAEQYLRIAAFIAEKRAFMGADEAKVRLALPSDAVFYRQWSFPFRSRVKIRKAVRLLLEAELPFSHDDIAIRLCPAGRREGKQVVLAVCMLAQRLSDWNEALERHGIEQELLTAHPFSLLPVIPAFAQEGGTRTRKPVAGLELLDKIRERFSGDIAASKKLAEPAVNGEKLVALCQKDKITFSLVHGGRVRAVWDCDPEAAREIVENGRKGEALFHLLSGEAIDFQSPALVFGDREHCLEIPAGTGKPGSVQIDMFSNDKLSPALRSLLSQLERGAFGEGGPKESGTGLELSCGSAENGATAGSPGLGLARGGGQWGPVLGLVCAGAISLFGGIVSLPVLPAVLGGKIPDFHARNSGNASDAESFPARRMLRLAAWPLAITLVWSFSTWAGTSRLTEESRALDEAMRRDFKNAVPGVTTRLGPTQMLAVLKERSASLEQHNAPENGQPGFLDVFRTVHEVTPPELGIVLNSVSFDGQRVALSGTAADFSEVERFREVLSGVPGMSDARILSAISGKRSQERIGFEIDFTRRAAE